MTGLMIDVMSPIRSIHVVPSVSEEASGPTYSVLRLCESVIAEGNQVTLATLDWGSMSSRPSFLKTFAMGIGPRRLGHSMAMHRWIGRQAESRLVDLIHNHSLWMMPNVYPGWSARKYHLPLIVSPRGTLSEWAMQSGSKIKRLFWPLIQHPALVATSCFHATSESEYMDIRRMGFKQPVAIIPNGIDVPPFKKRSHDRIRSLLFLGRIHPVKGVDLLLQAWRVVSPRFPEWRLRVVGPDNDGYLQKMEALAVTLALDRIEFSGPLYGDAKLEAYQESDLFVLPTHSENFGMSVAEALAAATPVIVSKGAPWSGIETRGAGWWIDIGLEPLVACLRIALAEPRDELQAMGERGRIWMQSAYAWESVARKMNQTYDWILKKDKKPDWVIED